MNGTETSRVIRDFTDISTNANSLTLFEPQLKQYEEKIRICHIIYIYYAFYILFE